MSRDGQAARLKALRRLLDEGDVERLRGECHTLGPPRGNPLSRLFGDFGENKRTEPVEPWMIAWGERMLDARLFSEHPNQYRVCDWIGEYSAQLKRHIDGRRHGEELLVIALTDGREIGFRPPGRPHKTWTLSLNAGDAYFMRGAARWQREHRVMPTGRTRGGGRGPYPRLSAALMNRRSPSQPYSGERGATGWTQPEAPCLSG